MATSLVGTSVRRRGGRLRAALLGILLDGGLDRVASLLLPTGGVLLAVGFGLPVVTTVEAGLPFSGIMRHLADRRQNMSRVIRDRHENMLLEVASDIVLDESRAARLVALAIERAAGHWRGPITEHFDAYLLCCVVRECLADWHTDPPLEKRDMRLPLASVARQQRAVWALQRDELSNEAATQIVHQAQSGLPSRTQE